MSEGMGPREHAISLVRGRGQYVADVRLPGQLAAVVVRSSTAHGELRGIDSALAREMPGVRAVLTAADLGESIPRIPMRLSPRADLAPFLQPVLASDRVRYVGEPVAVVVADSQYLAEDAAENVLLDIEELPALVHAGGTDTSSTRLFPGTDSNVVCELRGAFGDVDATFAAADHVVTQTFRTGRHSGVPMETRGLVARWTRENLELWGATKAVHVNRRLLSGLLGVPEEQMRFHGTDTGGGFGVRGELYPEDVLIPWLARFLECPVIWVEDRREHLMAINHSREQWHEASLAMSAEGRFLAIRDHFYCDMGAYVRTVGARVPELTIASIPGPYRWEAYDATCSCLLSNKTPTGTMRSPGRLEATFVRERLIDLAAHAFGMDPIELRSRNLLNTADMPLSLDFGPGTLGAHYDSGDYPAVLIETLRLADYDDARARVASARREGRHAGLGVVTFTEKTGVGPVEGAAVTVHEDGTFLIESGASALGQGVEATLATIAADTLQVPADCIRVQCGDTHNTPFSLGTFGSRSTIFAGSAVEKACCTLLEMATEMAEALLEFGPVSYHGEFIAGPHHRVGWGELVRGAGQGNLRAEGAFEQREGAMAFGVQLAEVEVDPGTGGVTVQRLAIGYDVGRAISRERVAAQLIGGVVHGLGGAMWEEFRYDSVGQPQNTSFMDYLLPTCAETPPIEAYVFEWSKATNNPLGVKGAGEGGVPGVAAAIAAAVDDALGPYASPVAELPMTPDLIRALVDSTDGAR